MIPYMHSSIFKPATAMPTIETVSVNQVLLPANVPHLAQTLTLITATLVVTLILPHPSLG